MANRFVFPNVQRFDANGNPGAGWKLGFYKPGTSTRKDTYSDADLTTPNTNPVVANADGTWDDIYMDGTYDVRLLDADDVQQESWDGVKGPIFAAVGSGEADGVPTNAYIGAFVPEILDGGTDAYTTDFGRTVGTGETAVGDVQSPNETTTPTLNGDVCTTKDGSVLWEGALDGWHRFQKQASSWLVLDPNPSSQVDPIAYADDAEADAKSYADAGDPTLQTAVDATNGGADDLSEIDFTSIKAGANLIVVGFDAISLDGAVDVLVQIGDSGGIEATGYEACRSSAANTSGNFVQSSTSGFIVRFQSATAVVHGHMVLTRLTGNIWTAGHSMTRSESEFVITGAGSKELSAELDRIRVATSGAANFDGGTVNVMVE